MPDESESVRERTHLRREVDRELHLLLECKPSYFISAERLGMIEQSIASMASTPDKRKRAIAFKEIEKVLKTLHVIEKKCEVTGIAYGCMPSGQAGMFVLCQSPTKLISKLPEELT